MFPADADRIGTNITANTTTPVVNLPSGILPGHMLLGVLRAAGSGAAVSFPADWTQLFTSTADPSDDTTTIAWKVADGSEGATITCSSGNHRSAAIVWRIEGAEGRDGPERTSATGTSDTPDPPSYSTSWGALDTLWLWIGGWGGEQTSPPAGNPTNYSNPIGADSGTAGAATANCRVAGASRQLNAATEDPPSWTISASDDWTAITVAIRPEGLPEVAMPPYRAA